MAFDHENHTIDPATGFQVHKETGHRIGIDSAPHRPVDADPEWPKWVVPHEGHVVRRKVEGAPDHLGVPAFPHHHVSRHDGSVTVMVSNPEEESLASSNPSAAKGEEAPRHRRRTLDSDQ